MNVKHKLLFKGDAVSRAFGGIHMPVKNSAVKEVWGKQNVLLANDAVRRGCFADVWAGEYSVSIKLYSVKEDVLH